MERFPQALTHPHRDELLVRVFFASRLPLPDLRYQLQRFLREQQDQLASYDEVDRHIGAHTMIHGRPEESFYWRLTMKRGIAMVKADIQWVEECIREIEEKERSEER